MSNIDSIIADVMSEFDQYKSAIDEDTVYAEAILSVKQFGNNATEDYEDVVTLKNGVAKLPENFYKLGAAFLCSEIKDDHIPDFEIRTLIEDSSVVTVNNVFKNWNNCCYCQEDRGYEVKNESTYSTRTTNNNKCFADFEQLRINKFANKKNCLPSCFTFTDNTSKKEISVDFRSSNIKANFESGEIYINYKGFPMDDNGNMDFTDTANSNFYLFMQYSLRTKIAEMLAIKPDTQAVANMLGYYAQNKEIYRKKVRSELVSSKYDPERFERNMKKANRRDYNRNSVYRR